MGNIPHHDVLHSHPVLPGGGERPVVVESVGRRAGRAMRKGLEPMGHGPSGKEQSLPGFAQGELWAGGSKLAGLPASLTVDPAAGGDEGVLGHLLPLTHSPSVARPCVLVAAPAQLGQVGQFLDSDDAVVEGGL